MRSLFIALILLTASPLDAADPPKLLVLVAFDQMRGDYLQRWQKLFGTDGFARLQQEGAWYQNCHYPYAHTQTGPGHASMLTGCAPDQHGIIMNQWYDRKTGVAVNCSQSDRYERVPALPNPLPREEFKDPKSSVDAEPKTKMAGSPDRILAPTVGDVLKAINPKSKVVGLSFKDRSALLPVGKDADAVYWLDSLDGMIVTSSCYRSSLHPWVADFNRERVADRWFDKEWVRLGSVELYNQNTGPEKGEGASKGIRQGLSFPHMIDGGNSKPGKSYYEALFNSPFGNDMLLELVKRAITSEKLGQDDVTDLLVVSFSSNDAIGHCWGPDSHEVLDVTLRADGVMADLLKYLDQTVGKGNYTLALTADHGICPLPEFSTTKGTPAQRLPSKALAAALEKHLRAKYDPEGKAGKANFIESFQGAWFYLDQTLLGIRGIDPAVAAREAANFIAKQDGVYRVFTRADLARDYPLNDPIGQRMTRSFHPERSGDVAFVAEPFTLLDSMSVGTNHGSPHRYDTHVPLLFYGKNITPGIRPDAVTPQSIAAVLSASAGVAPPEKAAYPVPPGLINSK